MRRATRHPVTTHIDFNDHKARAAAWGEECVRSIRLAIANPHYTTRWDLEGDHAVRAAKMAHWHWRSLRHIGRDG